uniref:BZIP transcription factor n=1 Tax=Zea mays TaxID=4577 RepID=A0A804MBW3_MAIZE
MGCKGSKLDDQEAVALCRARAELLAAAVRHRYALADAHAALADSIDSVAAPLHRLLRLQAESPGLTLPSARKGGGAPADRLPRSFRPSSSAPQPAHGHSSHLQFGASPGSEPPSPAESPPRRVPEQLQHPHPHHAAYGYEYDYATQPAYAYPPTPAGSLQFYYARSRPPPASVAVTQRVPGPPERVVRFGSFDAAGGYPQQYAYSAQRAPIPPPAPAALQRAAPPAPPKASSWDFLNVFENYDSYEYDTYYYDSATAATAAAAPYTPSRSSREVREEEGIPDLEDDDDEDSVVVNEVAGQYSAPGSGGARSRRSSLGGVSATAELDQAENIIDVIASSKMMSAISVAHLGCKDMDAVDVGVVAMVDSQSLSSALEKLYFWERKLYAEVKAEEKMRLLISKNSKRLKLLDQKGAEPQKIDATRNLLRKLSTKIRIAVRVIAKISRKINKLRDEELWPQVNALIQGFVLMWQDKLDSYHRQCQVISEAKNCTSVLSGENGQDLVLELEVELIKWIISFSSWVNSQRNFVKALNGWLALCLNYEPEDNTAGVPSYSPGSMGAPLVFVTCNKWSQAMDQISEKDVVNAMQALVSSVRHLWEQEHLEQSEQIISIREREKWIKFLERKTQDISKEADELNKKLALIPSRHRLHVPRIVQLYEAHCVEASSLHINLRLVLEALENFAANSLQAFLGVSKSAEGTRLPRDNVRRERRSSNRGSNYKTSS